MAETKQLSPFGIWLKEKREARRLSVRQLAERVEFIISPSRISQIENNTYPGKKGEPTVPGADIVDALASALGEAVNEARALANLPLSGKEMSQDDVITEFTYTVSKYQSLSPRARKLANKHFAETIEFLLESEQPANLKTANKMEVHKETPVKETPVNDKTEAGKVNDKKKK